MVVDDEEALRMLVRTLLLKQGHEVTEVESCGALRKAFGGPPPAVARQVGQRDRGGGVGRGHVGLSLARRRGAR